MSEEKEGLPSVREVVDAVAEVCQDAAQRREAAALLAAGAVAGAPAGGAVEVLARWRERLPEPASEVKAICSKC